MDSTAGHQFLIALVAIIWIDILLPHYQRRLAFLLVPAAAFGADHGPRAPVFMLPLLQIAIRRFRGR